MDTATLPYGVSHARTVEPERVDLTAVFFDPTEQISKINDNGALMPLMKHTTGTTSTNTANQDNKGGADKDSDARED